MLSGKIARSQVASPQDDSAVTEIRPLAIPRSIGQIRIVDPASFVHRPPRFKIETETMMPAAANGQIRYFGGPLQNYLNIGLADPLRDLHSPFGATAVAPIAHGRVELFGGMGGVWAPFHSSYAMTDSWLVQTSAGARVALDSGRHVWLGTTARYMTNFADKKRQWVAGTADLTVRFGR